MAAKSRTAIVTGASGSIGAATAAGLCLAGWRVVGIGTRTERLVDVSAQTGCATIVLDVLNAHEVELRLADIEPDLLVHAAGILGPGGKLYEMPAARAAHLVETNILGTLNMLRALVPNMVRRNSGHVILVGSVVGLYPGAGPVLYGATKAAVHAMARDLRSDLYGTAVRVTEILPGRVRTGIHRQLAGSKDSEVIELYDGYACLEPGDIAASILYAAEAPAHVDITQLEILPTYQVPGGIRFWKQGDQ